MLKYNKLELWNPIKFAKLKWKRDYFIIVVGKLCGIYYSLILFYLYAICFIGFIIFCSCFILCKCRYMVIIELSLLPDHNFPVRWTVRIKFKFSYNEKSQISPQL